MLPQAAFYTFKKALNYFYDVAAGKAQRDWVYFSLLLQLQKSCGRHFTSHLNKCFITVWVIPTFTILLMRVGPTCSTMLWPHFSILAFICLSC